MANHPFIFRPIERWPGELRRTRSTSSFKASWSDTKALLLSEVAQLQGRRAAVDVVVQLAVTEADIRQDGWLRAGTKIAHPGVIVSFPAKGQSLRFSTDQFTAYENGWRHNVRAIALGLEALRKVDRYGLGQGTEQYTGFQALPPATPMGAGLTIDTAIEILDAAAPNATWDYDRPEQVQRAWREAARAHHPDAGGDPDMFRRITEARDLLIGNLMSGWSET